MSNKTLRYLVYGLLLLLALQWMQSRRQPPAGTEDVTLLLKGKAVMGKTVTMEVRNGTKEPVEIPAACPKNPLAVERYQNGEWKGLLAALPTIDCSRHPAITVPAQGKTLVNFGPWSRELFAETGRYRVSLGKFTREIEVVPPSLFKRAWETALHRPILNVLVFSIQWVPGHSLGWGVVLLTIMVKLLLLAPNHKALRAQKAMQKVQPELDALKEKHKSDPQKLAQETMEVWKKHRVSPLSSCLPMLIQFPILIALFYVVKDGPELIDPALLYGSLKTIAVQSINPVFLGLDLTRINWTILPILVGGLQYLQMHMTFKKTAAIQAGTEAPNPMNAVNNSMKIMMPVMIGVFTATLPAAVGLYWGTSTLFGIAQQWAINRTKD